MKTNMSGIYIYSGQWQKYLPAAIFLAVFLTAMPVAGYAQLLRRNEYGVGVTVSI